MKIVKFIVSLLILVVLGIGYLTFQNDGETSAPTHQEETQQQVAGTADQPTETQIDNPQTIAGETITLSNIPDFDGTTPYVTLNSGDPSFLEEDYTTNVFEQYSELDSLGRCGVAFANVGHEIMPTEEREKIGTIKPSGWHTVKYDIVDKKYLYNRCHLIGFQLTGENANEKNLLTGTRYFNIEGMLPFENEVAYYIRRTRNHVLYRTTPIYEGDNLVASGVQLEAASVEDDKIRFNVYIYNEQPGVTIDHSTGHSHYSEK